MLSIGFGILVSESYQRATVYFVTLLLSYLYWYCIIRIQECPSLFIMFEINLKKYFTITGEV